VADQAGFADAARAEGKKLFDRRGLHSLTKFTYHTPEIPVFSGLYVLDDK